ncbi:hypothetical protein [Streptacidiphilus sp. EB103A]
MTAVQERRRSAASGFHAPGPRRKRDRSAARRAEIQFSTRAN